MVGDRSTSLIHTCELNGVNSFRYLTELQRHSAGVKHAPADWIPWKYSETLGVQSPAPCNIIIPIWLKRIDCDQGERSGENG
jgi:hypothetical protein